MSCHGKWVPSFGRAQTHKHKIPSRRVYITHFDYVMLQPFRIMPWRQQRVKRVQFLPSLPSDDIEGWVNSVATQRRANVSGQDTRSIRGSEMGHPACNTVEAEVSRKKRRADFPQVRSVEKGGASHAISMMSQPHHKRQALDELVNDMYATTSRAPRDALLKTWYKFHESWFGSSDDVLPITEDKILKVSTYFKKGGYKSVKNYFSRIKDHHVMAGYHWDERLELIAKKCTRSVLRGLGGAQRSEAFDFEKVVAHLASHVKSLNPEGPVNPVAVVVTATLFMLREVEASAIELGDVTFGESTVCLRLPVSKVDWQAKGCSRTWNCLCSKDLPCPVHLLKEHIGFLKDVFPGKDVPLFPTQDGEPCTKQGVVNTIRAAVDGSGDSGNNGHWRYSGHTFRITGARLLCRLGLDPITIQLLGRWGSSAVLTYLSEAPLDCFHDRIGQSGRVATPDWTFDRKGIPTIDTELRESFKSHWNWNKRRSWNSITKCSQR